MPSTKKCALVAGLALAVSFQIPIANSAPTIPVTTTTWSPLGEPGVGGQITSIAVSPFDPSRVLMGGDILGAALSEDGGESWQPTFGFGSWEIADFTFHPTDATNVWVGTMGGPYESVDGGHTWTSRRTGMPAVANFMYSAPIQKVLIDPVNASHLLAFGGSHRELTSGGTPAWGAIWESFDAGMSWTLKSSVARNILSVAMVNGSLRSLLVSTRGAGVMRSDDGGATWAPSNVGLGGTNVRSLAVAPNAPIVFAAVGAAGDVPGGIWKSVDGGRTWSPSNTGLARQVSANPHFTSSYNAIAMAPSATNVLYTADRSGSASGIYRSTDDGASWTVVLSRANKPVVPWGTAPSADAFAIDPNDPNVVFAGQQEYGVRTTDGGQTWADISSRPVGSTFAGRGFSGIVAQDIAMSRSRPGLIYLAGMDGGNLLMSRDAGATWTRPLSGYDNWNGSTGVAVGGRAGDCVYVLLGQYGFNGIARSTDGGATWLVVSGAAAGLPERAMTTAPPGRIAASTREANRVWATIDGVLYRSSDGGRHWLAGAAGLALGDIAVAETSPRTIFVGGAAGLYQSTDDGATLRLVAGSPANPTRLAIDPSNPRRLYFTNWLAVGGGVWRYEQSAFTQLRADSTLYDVAVDPTNPARLVAVTGDHPFHDVARASGVWVSSDAGATWNLASTGLPMTRINTAMFDPAVPGRVVIGTLGRGFFTTLLGTGA